MFKLQAKFHIIKPLLLILIITIAILFTAYYLFLLYFQNRFFPRISVAGENVGGLTLSSARQDLSGKISQRLHEPLILNYHGQTYSVNLQETQPNFDLDEKINTAYSYGRSSNPFTAISQQALLLLKNYDTPVSVNFRNQTALDNQLSSIGQNINQPPVNAQLNFTESVASGSSQITLAPSQEGAEIDKDQLLLAIKNYLISGTNSPINIPVKQVQPKFSTQDAQAAQQVIENIDKHPIELDYADHKWKLNQKTLIPLLYLGNTTSDISPTNDPVKFRSDKIADYLENIASQINQPVQEARFNYDPSSQRAAQFQAAQQGRELDRDQTEYLIAQALTETNPETIKLPVRTVEPKITTAEVNNLGIKELVGQGVSYFTGSITNRIYNLELAASRINGVLIPPQGTFSFINAVGDISGASGYKPAYVIKSGRTVLDDGGGVCQVSTTVFRAILNAGLPITARTAHAYRVGYYEIGSPPGLDATIFAPSVDLKFLNDTQNYILVQSYVKDNALYVNLYGTRDGRVVTMTKPKILSQTPPPPDIHQDDPTLPVGQVQQVEHAAWGAKVSFKRTVVKDGKTVIDETWSSNYQPWAAVYLVGTKQG